MVKVCAVKSCPTGRKKLNGRENTVSLFQASTPLKQKRWAESLGIRLKKSAYVCQHHFREADMKFCEKIKIGNVVHTVRMLRKTLNDDALPTLEHQSHISSDPQKDELTLLEMDELPEQEETTQSKEESQIEQGHRLNKNPDNIDDDLSVEEIVLSDCESMLDFKKEIDKIPLLPENWFLSQRENCLEFVHIDRTSKNVVNHIIVNDDFSVTAILSNNEKLHLDHNIISIRNLYNYLKSVEDWPRCVGTQVERRKFSNNCKGVIIGNESYKRFQANPRCKPCRVLRNQILKYNSVAIGSLEKAMTLKNSLTRECRRLQQMLIRLKREVLKAKTDNMRQLRVLHNEAIVGMPSEFKTVVTSCYETAKRQNFKTHKCTLDWIYECVLIKMQSKRKYEVIRDRNILRLPSLKALNKFLKQINYSAYGFSMRTFHGLKEVSERIQPSHRRGVVYVNEIKVTDGDRFTTDYVKRNDFIDLRVITDSSKYTDNAKKISFMDSRLDFDSSRSTDNLKRSNFTDTNVHSDSSKSTDSVIVFKFAPVSGKWIQVLGCFVTRHKVTEVPVHKLVIECVVLLCNHGFFVDVIVADGDVWETGVWKSLGISRDSVSCGHPCSDSKRLWMLCDFTYLMRRFEDDILKGDNEEIETPCGVVDRLQYEKFKADGNYGLPTLKIGNESVECCNGSDRTNTETESMISNNNICNIEDVTPTSQFQKLICNLVKAMMSYHENDALRDCRQRQAILSFLDFLKEWQNHENMVISDSTLDGFNVTLSGALQALDAVRGGGRWECLKTWLISQDPLEIFSSIMRSTLNSSLYSDPNMFALVYRITNQISFTSKNNTIIKNVLRMLNYNILSVENKQKWLENIDKTIDTGVYEENGCNENNFEVINSVINIYVIGYICRKLRTLKCVECLESIMYNREDLINDNISIELKLFGGNFLPRNDFLNLTHKIDDCLLKNEGLHFEVLNRIISEICEINFKAMGCVSHSMEFTKILINLYAVIRIYFGIVK